jgi:large subunit ribosomal protein L10
LAITRKKKEELVARYKELIENSTALVFTDYRGVTVSQIQSLRTAIQEADGSYLVAKNTLLNIALKECDQEIPEELLAGPNAVLFSGEDIGRSVTVLKQWIKQEKIVEIKGALMEGSVLDAASAEALANLPTKEQLLGMILSTINGPARELVGVINAPAASLVRVINAHIEKEQEEAA